MSVMGILGSGPVHGRDGSNWPMCRAVLEADPERLRRSLIQTTSDPTRVTCEDCLREMDEPTLTRLINGLRDRVRVLVLARRGRTYELRPTAEKNPAWCVLCGDSLISAEAVGEGFDTCRLCLNRLYGKTVGVQFGKAPGIATQIDIVSKYPKKPDGS